MQIETHQLHIREHASFLATPEKHALVWMARHLPACITPDQLTLLGFASMILAGASYWAASRNRLMLLLSVVGLALNWLGDSLDGTLARVRNRQRPRYGWYVDHVVDIVGTAVLLVGLSFSGYMHPYIGLALLVVFLMVESEAFLATHSLAIFRLSFMGFGPTELRIILAAGTLTLLGKPAVHIASTGPYRLFDVGGLVAIVCLGGILVASVIRNTRSLYRAERLPR
jgi:archaetidylinositol phosphate synthase